MIGVKTGIVFICCLLFIACTSNNKHNLSIDQLDFSYPDFWPQPTYTFKGNALTHKRIALGKKLFFDKRLSSDSTISCESCHHQKKAFSDGEYKFSFGVNGKQSLRNTPALFNLAWSKTFMWDGGVNHIEFQPIAPITNPLEMNESMEHVIHNIATSNEYQLLFKEAYDTDSITSQLVLKAFAQFLGSLVSYDSKYDRIMRKYKEYSFIDEEAKGYVLFKKSCASCHTEPLFTNHAFENNGLSLAKVNPDYGRLLITKLAEDSMKFKVPSLRNLQFTAPYMHDGRFRTLSEVIDHYSSGIVNYPNKSHKLDYMPKFTRDEKQQLIAFLQTLDDPDFCLKPMR